MAGSLRSPPCPACPKIGPGEPACPDTGRRLDAPAWPDVLRWFLRGKAVGFSPAADEAADHLADLGAVVAGWVDARKGHEEHLRRCRKPVRLALPVLHAVAFG